jgi:hypothetical protein
MLFRFGFAPELATMNGFTFLALETALSRLLPAFWLKRTQLSQPGIVGAQPKEIGVPD